MDAKIASNNTMSKKNIADLLPELTSLLAEDMLVRTGGKKPRDTLAVSAPRTTEKFKPLTIAEMKAEMEAVKGKSTKKSTFSQAATSTMKKKWNSSIKVDKKIVSHTGDGQMRNNPVRKVLCFNNKQQATTSNTRATMVNTETPKFPKPESRAKKSLHQLRAKDYVRISGVYKIQETPVESEKPIKSRVTIGNKENIINPRISYKAPAYTHVPKILITPVKPVSIRKSILQRVPDTPTSNDSWKSSCDASFLLQEKEIQDVQDKIEALLEQPTLENIAEISPPVSTPFKDYRNVQEYFNNSSDMENSVNDNTIMCFDKPSICRDNEKSKHEESVIVSLCDLLNKATVTNNESTKSELEILIEIKKETEDNIKSQTKLLKYVNNLIKKKKNNEEFISSSDKTLEGDAQKIMITEVKYVPEKSPIRRVSVIKSPVKSPSYVIPKRSPCLRKKVFHKSMPGVSNCQTPTTKIESSNRALTMYMRMKEQMNFLNTPLVKQKPTTIVPDTPAMTSHNLQLQLDKLFNNS